MKNEKKKTHLNTGIVNEDKFIAKCIYSFVYNFDTIFLFVNELIYLKKYITTIT